jgi:hypothetical protein
MNRDVLAVVEIVVVVLMADMTLLVVACRVVAFSLSLSLSFSRARKEG